MTTSRLNSVLRSLSIPLMLAGLAGSASAELHADEHDRELLGSVLATIEQQHDRTHAIGIPPAVHEQALHLTRLVESALGKPLEKCLPPHVAQGEVIGFAKPTEAARPSGIAPIDALVDLLGSKRAVVRNSAAYLLGELGPAAITASPALKRNDMIWFAHALGRIECQPYGMGGARSAAFAAARVLHPHASLQTDGNDDVTKVAVLLLEDGGLRWPDRFFASLTRDTSTPESSSIDPRAVKRLARIAIDSRREPRLRIDVTSLLGSLGLDAAAGAKILHSATDSPDEELAYTTRSALARIGGKYGSLAAAGLLRERQVPVWLIENSLPAIGKHANALVEPLIDILGEDNWDEAETAARMLGAIADDRAVEPLLRALEHRSWLVETAAATALHRWAARRRDVRDALQKTAMNHWSGRVRDAARVAPVPPPAGDANGAGEATLSVEAFACFHRCFIDHRNGTCAGEDIRDGRYMLPGTGVFDVTWSRAVRHPLPSGFPVAIVEDSRPDYGTNTFLRIEDGWLFGTDRWHYDGGIWFASGTNPPQALGAWGDSAVTILDTPHFGRVFIGKMFFTTGSTGVLARLERDDSQWTISPVVALPSVPWAWSFAPDGTLLVADTANAVAVHADGRIENLSCPARLDVPGDDRNTSLLDAMASLEIVRSDRTTIARNDLASALAEIEELHAASDDDASRPSRPGAIAEMHARVGTLQASLGQNEEALQSFREAVRLAPDNIDYSTGLAEQLSILQRDSEAYEQSMRLLALNSAHAMSSAAFWYMSGARYTESARVLADLASRKSELADDSRTYSAVNAAAIAAAAPSLDANLSSWDEPSPPDRLTWPQPLVEMLRGRMNEAMLVNHVRSGPGALDADRLCEALYFRALQLEGQGQAMLARRYHEAAVLTGVIDFREYHAAKRAISRLNAAEPGRSPVPKK